MAAKKSAAPKKTTAKKAKSPPKAPKKHKTSSAPGESAEAHKWLMQSQEVSTEGLPIPVSSDEPNIEIEDDTEEAAALAVIDGRNAKTGQFVKGEYRGGPGRPKGSRNKFAESFIDDFYADWLEHGAAVIAAVRAEKPDVYFKGAVAILPKQMDVRVSEFAELKDDALDAKMAEMQRELSAAMAILRPQGSA